MVINWDFPFTRQEIKLDIIFDRKIWWRPRTWQLFPSFSNFRKKLSTRKLLNVYLLPHRWDDLEGMCCFSFRYVFSSFNFVKFFPLFDCQEKERGCNSCCHLSPI